MMEIMFFFSYDFRNDGFDIEKVKQAAKQMEGIHDFRSFMKVSKEQKSVILKV